MLSFFVLVIYLLLLFSDGEEIGWIRFLYGGSVEDEGDNYGVNNFLGMTTCIFFFPNDDIKEVMMSPLWNNFL